MEENPRGLFWELHQRLADCYVHDLGLDGGVQSVGFAAHGFEDGPRSPSLPHYLPSVAEKREVVIKTLLDTQTRGNSPAEGLTLTNVELAPHRCYRRRTQKKNLGKCTSARTVSVDALAQFDLAEPEWPSTSPKTKGAGRLQQFMLHPGGVFRTAWNLVLAVCVLHDLIVVPLQVFSFEPGPFMVFLDKSTQLFWNCDFFVSIRTGCYIQGALVMDQWTAALHYAKTWMCFDILLISLDWCILWIDAMGQQGELVQWSRTLQLLRFLRLVRMLRWVKLRRVNEVFQELLHSQAASLYYSLIGSIARLLIHNHLVSCAWFGIGLLESESWVTRHKVDTEPFEQQYLTCLNWAFAQLSVGSSDILPLSTLELAFAVLISFKSLITYSTLISTMTSLMTGLSKIKEDETTEFRLLRQYLVHNDIPQGLNQRITRFLQHQYALKQQAKSSDLKVPLLELLSQQLRSELYFARFRNALSKISFLQNLLASDDVQTFKILHGIATNALRDMVVAKGEVVFLGGSSADFAYLKVQGRIAYYHSEKKDLVDDTQWLAEVCLWTPWIYMGDLVAEDYSCLAVMTAKSFGECLCQNWATQRAAAEHARKVVDVIQEEALWSDLPNKELPEVVVSHPASLEVLAKPRCCFPFKAKCRVQPSFDSLPAQPSTPTPVVPGTLHSSPSVQASVD